MPHTVALLTPSHSKDIERFELLCDSIDRHVKGYARHYVIVNDGDVPVFARFASDKRVILPSSEFLPKWLRLLPSFLSRNGRRVWWSFRSPPVHGWHIQQLLKISAVLQLPEQRFCIVDSDNVFFRPFDASAYAGRDKAPMYIDKGAIAASAPLHAVWTKSCDRLLNQPETAFPADDYVGNGIIWDKAAVRGMTQTIEQVGKGPWQAALCKTRAFSEYLLYGHFVRNSPLHNAAHEIVQESLAHAYWDEAPLDAAAVAAMVREAPASKVALCIESFSNTPVSIIRETVGLARPSAAARLTAQAA
jgi:hypothetical protein